MATWNHANRIFFKEETLKDFLNPPPFLLFKLFFLYIVKRLIGILIMETYLFSTDHVKELMHKRGDNEGCGVGSLKNLTQTPESPTLTPTSNFFFFFR